MTQVSKRELSIVKTLDYVAKFIRTAMGPYIGRYTITPAFLKLINSILISISLYLIREGRLSDMKGILQERAELNNIISINKITGNRQGISIIGLVSDKKVTNNKNILLDIEDLTGKMKVLINQNKPELYEKAEEIALDSIVGFNGTGNKEILFANEVIFPDSTLPERKRSPCEEYALFIGDLHFGSKRFLEICKVSRIVTL